MRLQDFIIGLIVFACLGFTIFGFISYAYGSEGYGLTIPASDEAVMGNITSVSRNSFNSIAEDGKSISDNAPGGAVSGSQNSDLSRSDNIITSAMNVLSIATHNYGTFNSMLHIFANAIGVPEYFITLAFIAVIIALSVLFISSVLQNRL